MACCLTAPCHYLNQCWLIINGDLLHSSGTDFTLIHEMGLKMHLQNYFHISQRPMIQWHLPQVNSVYSWRNMHLKCNKNITRSDKIDMSVALAWMGSTCMHTEYGDISMLWWMRHNSRFALNMMPLTLRCWCWLRWAALEMTYVAINPFIRLCGFPDHISNIHGTIWMKFTGWMGLSEEEITVTFEGQNSRSQDQGKLILHMLCLDHIPRSHAI